MSTTTLGTLMATINGPITLIALPDIFGIGVNPLLPGNASLLLWLILGCLLVTVMLVVAFGRPGDMFGRHLRHSNTCWSGEIMGSLAWMTYVAAAKPVVSGHVAPGETREMWSPTSCTLIYGDRDAVLVDALLTMGEGQALAGWAAASGRNLTTIYITHGHGDHFFGASAVLERFPTARMVATRSVVTKMRQQVSGQQLDGVWRTRFPGQITEHPPIAEPLAGHAIDLEGEQLVAVELGHTDTDHTTALHVPSLGLVAAGDAVYNDVHLYLAEAGHGGIQGWLAALDAIESLQPSTVIAGHKRDGTQDSPDNIEKTRRYLQDFDDAAQRTDNAQDLYEAMIERYPDRINRVVVWNSAHAIKGPGVPANGLTR